MYSEETLSLLKEKWLTILAILRKEPSRFARQILFTAIADDAAEAASNQTAKMKFSKDLKALKPN